VTGFVNWTNICPSANSTLSITASVTTAFSDPNGSSTLVAYYFDRNSNLLGTANNDKVVGRVARTIGLYDSPIPANTRKIAVVPMAYISSTETGTIYYRSLIANYDPASTYTTVANENFATYGPPLNLPSGWNDFGAPWYVYPAGSATVWNPSWNHSVTLPVDTGLIKQFTLPAYAPGDTISATMFAANTFTDSNSFIRLRLVFNTPSGPFIESDNQYGNAWGHVNIHRQPIPAGSISVYVIANAYLGPTETSSLYVQNISVSTVH
jgi:hypothetical protein